MEDLQTRIKKGVINKERIEPVKVVVEEAPKTATVPEELGDIVEIKILMGDELETFKEENPDDWEKKVVLMEKDSV